MSADAVVRRLDTNTPDFTKSTVLRDHVLDLVRNERARQIETYGSNDGLDLGFGGNVSTYPWLSPYTEDAAAVVEETLRTDYEKFEARNGSPTWMHLIREEVAELFDTDTVEDAIDEAVQVAALCVSLVEHLFRTHEGQSK